MTFQLDEGIVIVVAGQLLGEIYNYSTTMQD